MGRPSKYNTHVQPFLSKVREWVEAGATVRELAAALEVNESTLYEYQKKYKEFAEALRPPRAATCCDIKTAMKKKAMGFYYEERKQYIKREDDGSETTYTEITERYCPPSEKAAAMLLNNYDENWRNSDAISVKMRQQEYELRQRIAAANNFDFKGE